MPNVIIYHNPRCSKSRQSLLLIQEQGIEPTIVEYLKYPPSVAELQSILKKLKLTPRDLIRQKEKLYSELKLSNHELSDSALLKAMSENPTLIERPIVISGDNACLGRPPENVLGII